MTEVLDEHLRGWDHLALLRLSYRINGGSLMAVLCAKTGFCIRLGIPAGGARASSLKRQQPHYSSVSYRLGSGGRKNGEGSSWSPIHQTV